MEGDGKGTRTTDKKISLSSPPPVEMEMGYNRCLYLEK
jgi:hypothetical protein